MAISANGWEEEQGQCISGGCTKAATWAVLADWNAWTQRPIMSKHCEQDARRAADSHIELISLGGKARQVQLVRLEQLEGVA